MTLFFVKLTLTPVLMGMISYAARRWGSAIGGLLAGLPITSAPISIYMALEQGNAFAAQAAVAALTGVGAVTVFYLVYGVAAGARLSVGKSVPTATLAFALAIILLHPLRLPLVPIVILDLGLVVAVLAVCRRGDAEATPTRQSAWDIPARIVAATTMVLLITVSARALGPDLSGLVSPIPVIAWPLVIFVHAGRGGAGAVAVIRGTMQGAFGIVGFYVAVAALLPGHGAVAAYATGLVCAAATTVPWLFRRPAAPVGRVESPGRQAR